MSQIEMHAKNIRHAYIKFIDWTLNSYYPLEVEENIVNLIQIPRGAHNIPFKRLDILYLKWRHLVLLHSI